MTQWQPIETAPKLKTVLIAFQTQYPRKMRVIRAQFIPMNTVQSYGEWAEYNEELDEYFTPEGWYEDVYNDIGEEYSMIHHTEKPKYWMSIPTPPEE